MESYCLIVLDSFELATNLEAFIITTSRIFLIFKKMSDFNDFSFQGNYILLIETRRTAGPSFPVQSHFRALSAQYNCS